MPTSLSTLLIGTAVAVAIAGASVLAVATLCAAAILFEGFILGSGPGGLG